MDPATIAALGVGAEVLKWLSSGSANRSATQAQSKNLDKAQQSIEQGNAKAIALQQPYLQNAGQDYGRLRDLIQGGYFTQPYGQTFTSQSYAPAGFSFSPAQGTASFSPWQPQGGPATFQPQALPLMPAYRPQAPMGPQAPTGQTPLPMDKAAVAQRAAEIIMRQSPAPMMSALTPSMSPQNTGLMGYNPQTGTGNPLANAGLKPQDPRLPTLQEYYTLKQRMPWLFGRSGPLEGGMPQGGMF